MRQALLFILGVVALVAIVPLATLGATGRPRDAWHALRQYGGHLLALALVIAVGALIGWLAAVNS